MKNVIVALVLAVAAAVVALLTLTLPSKESNEESRRRLGETVTASTDVATYIVTFPDRDVDPWDRCYALAESRGGTVMGIYEEVNACSLSMPRAAVGAQVQDEIAALVDQSYPNVMFEEDGMVYAWDNEESGDLHSPSTQRRALQTVWGLDRINQCTSTLDNTATPQSGENVFVYIIDTGIKDTHTEFTNRMGPSDCHFSAISGESALADGNGHGTHVAGTVCGNTYGVARGCTMCAVKVLSNSGSGSNSGVIAGINHVISDCATRTGRRCVINMSLGGGRSTALNDAVRAAVNNGIVAVVAAGNDNADACNYSPASESSSVTVGSTTSTDAESSFSNHGSCVDVFAPGSSIKSAWYTSNTATNTISGTSMASPHVAGIAVGILSANTGLTPSDVRDRIVSRADVISSSMKLATVVDCNSAASPSTPATSQPTSSKPTSSKPTSSKPTSSKPSSSKPTSSAPTSSKPTSSAPTGPAPMGSEPANPATSSAPTSSAPTSSAPTSSAPTSAPTSSAPTSSAPTSSKPTSSSPTSSKPTSSSPTSSKPTSSAPTSSKPTSSKPTTSTLGLATPICSTSGSSSTNRACARQSGNMLDVVAKTSISITAMKISVATGTTAEVWTRTGTHAGFENSRTGWTKVGVGSFTSSGLKTIPFTQSVQISAGSRQAFYTTTTDGTVLYGTSYTTDNANTIVAQNIDAVILPGTANFYPFNGFLTPRYWNGELIYKKV